MYLRAQVLRENMKRDQYMLETEQIQAFMERDKKELERLEAMEKKLLEEKEENKRRHQENIKVSSIHRYHIAVLYTVKRHPLARFSQVCISINIII